MEPVKFVYVPIKDREEFLSIKQDNNDIKACEIYVDRKTNKIYFVEGASHPPRGMRRELDLYEDSWGVSLDDMCKAINTFN